MNTSEQPGEKSLHDFFMDELARMKDAETQLTHAIPVLAAAAHSDDLTQLLHLHLKETEGHVVTIQKVAESLGQELVPRTCHAMEDLIKEGVVALVKEGTTVIFKDVDAACVDIAIIASARKIEHYEIASYRTLCSWAKQMGYRHELALLTSNFDQEKIAEGLLTKLAQGGSDLPALVQEVSLNQVGATLRKPAKPPEVLSQVRRAKKGKVSR